MKTRYGSSPWIHGFPDSRRPAYPRLRGELTADVAIVGGGLTGCVTAYACAMAGLRTIVIEAERIGHGGSGHSAGLLMPEPGPAFRDIVGAHGLRAGRRIFEMWRRASLDAASLVRRLGLRAALERGELVTIATNGGEKLLRRDFDARVQAGLDGRWLRPPQVRDLARVDASAAVRLGDVATLDPYRAALGFASAAAKRRARLFERSAATRIRAGRNDVEIATDDGIVRAQTVVIATTVPGKEFRPLQRHLARRQTYFAMTEPVPAAIRRQIVAADLVLRDTDAPPHRVRWTRDDRLIVGGADQDEVAARTRAAVLVQRTGQLMYELLKMYPAISGLTPEYGWDLTYGEAADGLIYVGAHRNYPRHLFAFGGRDALTGSFLAARILARAAAGAPEKGDELFGWTR